MKSRENKRVKLRGVAVDSCHRAKVLLLNPGKYSQSGIYHTSIVDAARFTPDCDLKAGSFYCDGQKLQFPAMKKGEEYEIGLRTCRNLEAQVTKTVESDTDERERQVEKTTYTVKLVNNTGSEQSVEVNIPTDIVVKACETYDFADIEHIQKTIAGEDYFVGAVAVEPHSSKVFKFSMKSR